MDLTTKIAGKRLAIATIGKHHIGLIRLPDNSFIIKLDGEDFGVWSVGEREACQEAFKHLMMGKAEEAATSYQRLRIDL